MLLSVHQKNTRVYDNEYGSRKRSLSKDFSIVKILVFQKMILFIKIINFWNGEAETTTFSYFTFCPNLPLVSGNEIITEA